MDFCFPQRTTEASFGFLTWKLQTSAQKTGIYQIINIIRIKFCYIARNKAFFQSIQLLSALFIKRPFYDRFLTILFRKVKFIKGNVQTTLFKDNKGAPSSIEDANCYTILLCQFIFLRKTNTRFDFLVSEKQKFCISPTCFDNLINIAFNLGLPLLLNTYCYGPSLITGTSIRHPPFI